MRKDLTKVYLKAAKLINENRTSYSCRAIDAACRFISTSTFSPAARFYAAVMYPNGNNEEFAEAIWKEYPFDEDARNFRLMLLCLMATCWRDFKEFME